MKQKIVEFKKQIRKQHIQQIFAQKRRMIQNSQQVNNNLWNILGQYHRNRRDNMFDSPKQKPESEQISVEQCTEQALRTKWLDLNVCILRALQAGNLEEYINLISIIYHDLKKVAHSKSQYSQAQKDSLFDFFLKQPTIVNVVNFFVEASKNPNISPGFLQKISIKSLGILQICIHNQPLAFTESIFINSNILLFLAYALNEPKFDFHHISKVLNVITHMILASTNQSGQLFSIINNRASKFHVGAVFFNLSKMPLQPNNNLTENFIIFMKHYLLQIDHYVAQNSNNDDPQQIQKEKMAMAKNICSLTIHQLEIALEVTIRVVNNLCQISFDSQDQNCYFEESLEVLRIIIQLFDVGERFKQKLKYNKLVNILSMKASPHYIKQKILIIVDHLIFTDESEELSFHLVKRCDLLSNLRALRSQSPNYIMNIFCNLVAISSIKQELSQTVQQIYLSINLNHFDKYFFIFTYNWFHSQKFKILTSFDKVLLQTLSDFDEVDEYKNGYQCLIWLKLAQNNEVQLPRRVVDMENQYSQRIRSEILNMPEREQECI